MFIGHRNKVHPYYNIYTEEEIKEPSDERFLHEN